MKILLVGEYSRLHNSLKEGLAQLGHEVTLMGNGDEFKKFPVDIDIDGIYFKRNFLLNKFRQLVYRIAKTDLAQYETAYRFWSERKKFVGYDVVQLINEWALQTPPQLEIKLLRYIFTNNRKAFLVSCGDDYTWVSFMLAGKFRYSALNPYTDFAGTGIDKHSVRYLTKPFRELHDFVYQNIEGVVASDIDYYLPLKEHPKCRGMIPNPVNVDKLVYKAPDLTRKITIFHGINEVSYYKKGNYLFEEALGIIEKKYAGAINIVTTLSMPYADYIRAYDSAHIVLDCIFAYDQGYNALEAMARGKVVFTGAETEFLQFYGLEHRVAVNALPDVNALVADLEFLIENPDEIKAMSLRARAFIEKEHDYVKIAQRYVDFWGGNNPV